MVVFTLSLAVSALLLWLALRNVDLDAAWATARRANLAWLVAGTLGVNVGVVAMAARWRSLSGDTGPHHPPYAGFLRGILVAQAVNNVVPARPGDVVRVAWLGRASGGGAARATASMLADRALDILMLGLIIAVGVLFVPRRPWVIVVALGALCGILLLVGLWVTCRRRGHLLSDDGGTWRGRMRHAAARFSDAFGSILTVRRAVAAFGWTAVIWGTWAVGSWAVAHALDLPLSLFEVLYVGAVLNVGLAIPSSPGFVGTYQWLIVAGAGLFDVPASAAFAYSVLLQATWFVPQTLVGLGLLPTVGQSFRTINHLAADGPEQNSDRHG